MTNLSDFEVNLSFDVSEETDLKDISQRIQQRLQALDIVKEVEAVPGEQRITGVEVAAAIGVTVVILHGSRAVIHELRLLLQEIKSLVNDIKGLKSASVEIGEKQVPADKVDEKDLQDLLEEIASLEKN